MFVYIINKDGNPLMPCRPQKARKLVKTGKAVIVRYEPFTLKLKFGSSGYKQPVTLGIDAGSVHIGASASTKKQELYASETILRSADGKASIVNLLAKRRELRRSRRNRKTRYRKARFQNRTHRKQKGWLPPQYRTEDREPPGLSRTITPDPSHPKDSRRSGTIRHPKDKESGYFRERLPAGRTIGLEERPGIRPL